MKLCLCSYSDISARDFRMQNVNCEFNKEYLGVANISAQTSKLTALQGFTRLVDSHRDYQFTC